VGRWVWGWIGVVCDFCYGENFTSAAGCSFSEEEVAASFCVSFDEFGFEFKFEVDYGGVSCSECFFSFVVFFGEEEAGRLADGAGMDEGGVAGFYG